MPTKKKKSTKKQDFFHSLLTDIFQEENGGVKKPTPTLQYIPGQIEHVQAHAKDMKNLAQEYQKSLYLLNARILELNSTLEELSADSASPEKDPEVIDLKERLKPELSELY